MIDTADMPTTHKFPLYGTNCPANDAPCVEILRAAGAIIWETDTTEFAAAGRNAITGNPHDDAHAGRVVLGSVAAVGMVRCRRWGHKQEDRRSAPPALRGFRAEKPSWG
ncbi:MAG: hypothetical protein R3D81_17270 [Thalassovita sp.]